MAQSLSDFLPILVQISLALGIVITILLVSRLFGHRSTPGKIKDSPYECGLPSDGKSRTRFAIKFYVIAMLFIVFDIELIFLVPWAVIYREFLQNGLPILLPVLFFLGVLVTGLAYEIRKGALEWER